MGTFSAELLKRIKLEKKKNNIITTQLINDKLTKIKTTKSKMVAHKLIRQLQAWL